MIPLSGERLEAIRQRCEKATKGPWLRGSWGGQCRIPEHGKRHPGPPACKYEPVFYESSAGIVSGEPDRADVVSTSYDELEIQEADAEFIAHAREDIPDLLAELARLRAETERLKQSIEDFNRNDHDERGAAETWHDCYLEQKARAEQAEAARAALESEVKRLKPLAELIAKDRPGPR